MNRHVIDEDDNKTNRYYCGPTNTPIPASFAVQHELDVFAEVADTVDPLHGHYFESSQNENDEALMKF